MKTHKYNIGQKVKIVKVNDKYSHEEFDKYIGKVYKITRVENGIYERYKLSLKNGTWWDAEELELVSPKAKTVNFIATKYKNNPINVKYYDKNWKPVDDKIEITKKSTDYRLNLGKYKIFATVSDKGITLTTMDDHDKFWFCNSTPEMIKNVASLMLEASKLK